MGFKDSATWSERALCAAGPYSFSYSLRNRRAAPRPSPRPGSAPPPTHTAPRTPGHQPLALLRTPVGVHQLLDPALPEHLLQPPTCPGNSRPPSLPSPSTTAADRRTHSRTRPCSVDTRSEVTVCRRGGPRPYPKTPSVALTRRGTAVDVSPFQAAWAPAVGPVRTARCAAHAALPRSSRRVRCRGRVGRVRCWCPRRAARSSRW